MVRVETLLMNMNIVVISKLHLIRQSLMQRLKSLGFNVYLFSDIQEFLPRFNLVNPDIILMDGDGAEKEWKLLAKGLSNVKKIIIFILLISAISIDSANEAIALGIAGIILKPFNPEEHIKKIMEIVHKNRSHELKRSAPRFYPDIEDRGTLSFFDSEKKEPVNFTLINISRRGALLHLINPLVKEELQPGYRIPDAELKLHSIELDVSCTVVHRYGQYIGVLFENIHTGKSQLYRYIETLDNNIFGTVRLKGKW